jgi:hypothetical protein
MHNSHFTPGVFAGFCKRLFSKQDLGEVQFRRHTEGFVDDRKEKQLQVFIQPETGCQHRQGTASGQ